jgi:hypothetical protein
MVTSERLRELAKQHRANAHKCPDLRYQYLELAMAYEQLADAQENSKPRMAVATETTR